MGSEMCIRDRLMCYCSGCMDFNYVLIDCVHVCGLLLGFNEDGVFVLIVLCIVYDCILCLCAAALVE